MISALQHRMPKHQLISVTDKLDDKGKLCNLTDASGSTRYGYDAFGNLATQVHTELNIAYTTAYTYDAGDRLLSITHPGGRVVNYTRDAIGRIRAIATTLNGVTTTITSARSYSADGTLNSQTWGNGKVETRTYDLQGRLTQLNVGTDTRRYTYDANGNVTQKVSTPETGNYTYDMLDRLASDNNGTNTSFGYDAKPTPPSATMPTAIAPCWAAPRMSTPPTATA